VVIFKHLRIQLIFCLLFLFGDIPPIRGIHSAHQRYQFESPQMGVPFRLILFTDQGESHAADAAAKVWERISNLNTILSNYETDSELSLLGYGAGQGNWTVVSDDLWNVICQAQRLSVSSEGAFDFTLGPATALWRKVRREKKMPALNVLDSMMRRTGWHRLLLCPEDQSVCLTVPGMRLDPGGIAKGFALDEGLKELGPVGISSALISGGGDMVVLNAPPGLPGLAGSNG
jgi:thiamine biosynthesis lipoprotein